MRALVTVLWMSLVGAPFVAQVTPSDAAYQAVDRAKSEAGSIPLQAMALAGIAWPPTVDDPGVASFARQELISFGKDGFAALRWAVTKAPPRFQADAVAALIESVSRLSADLPPEFLPALEEAIWFSSVEAKRLAIPELSRYRYPPAIISLVDAAYDYTELRLPIIIALGQYRKDNVRHFLLKMLREGTEEERHAAAESLARIGDRALATLRTATADPSRVARVAAVQALVPISSVEDLSRLHEYVGLHGEDDSALTLLVNQRTELLEELLERREAAQAATTID